MPEDILNNWRNWDQLAWLGDLRNNRIYRDIHLKIVSDIDNLRVSEVSEPEKKELFTDYYNHREEIIMAVFNKHGFNDNTQYVDWLLDNDKVQIWLPFFWFQDWNLLILWKFPWEDTLERNRLPWCWYFLNKSNWFWNLMNHLFGDCDDIISDISSITKDNFGSLSDSQTNFLRNNNIALWDMVHLCYSVDNSSADDNRVSISYSKIWDILLDRLERDEDMDLDIVIWGDRNSSIPEHWSMTYLDFISIKNRKPIDFSDDFKVRLWNIWIEAANIIEVSRIFYSNFKNNSFESNDDSAFKVKILHNWHEKNIRVILWYDSSAGSLSWDPWNKDASWYNEFFNRQRVLWEKYWWEWMNHKRV